VAKLRVLFVDDDPNILAGLKRMLYPLRQEWQTAFAPGGPEALELLSQEPFEIIVSDMRMPGMDGARLLEEVQKRHPQVIRIILSGHSDEEMILRSVRSAHQYLAKPCDAQSLRATIQRTCALRDLLADEKLRQVVAGMETLPSLPDLYAEIMAELRSENASMKRVGEIISKDLGMTAKMLQLVNSAFFGHIRHVASPIHAVELLGLEIIKSLVLSVQIFSQLELSRVSGLSPKALWQHSLGVGLCARAIALEAKQPQELVDDAFLAGVLHDAGKLILAANFPDNYKKIVPAEAEGVAAWCRAEEQAFGVTHAAVGAYLFSLWGFSYPLVEAVAFHHEPRGEVHPGFAALTAVHVGDALERSLRREDQDGPAVEMNLEYLEALGLTPKLEVWRKKCCRLLEDLPHDL
jgi:HD-like signal output (HDOD) protein